MATRQTDGSLSHRGRGESHFVTVTECRKPEPLAVASDHAGATGFAHGVPPVDRLYHALGVPTFGTQTFAMTCRRRALPHDIKSSQ